MTLSELVEAGTSFHIDLNKRTCKVGKKILMDKEWNKALDFEKDEDILLTLQKKYDEYRVSTPSERSSAIKNTYFKALDYDELSDIELIKWNDRESARLNLELCMLYIVCHYQWHELFNPRQFFYRGNNGLRVMKNWFKEM